MGKKIGQSLGILAGLKDSIDEEKENKMEVKKETSLVVKEDKRLKRAYCLSSDAIKKLGEMKLYDFPGTSLESIVEKAIIYYYENKHKEG